MKEITDDCIGLCEECCKTFTPDEMRQNRLSCKWGHPCKMKDYKSEHRCESYIKIYKEV